MFCAASMMILLGGMSALASSQSESPSLVGTWKIEMTFSETGGAGLPLPKTLRFQAQENGTGSFQVLDPKAHFWGADKLSEAKWSRGEGDVMTFSGAIEFPLGNVGREAGNFLFKGKFQTPDVITGDAEFSPLVGDRPSRHGTFKAVRAGAK